MDLKIMNGKIIKDIRVYKSDKQNEYGIPSLHSFGDKKLNAIIHRIVMKLRENSFSFGDFDHLYIVFTTVDIKEERCLSEIIDKYHPWYRYCFVRINDSLYKSIGKSHTYDYLIETITKVLIEKFCNSDFNVSLVCECVKQAVEQGEKMLMKYKEKVTSKRKAIIYLRYLDSSGYYPLLRVFDLSGNLLFEKDLPQNSILDEIGEIQLSLNKVTIKPRKNAFTSDMKMMIFEY